MVLQRNPFPTIGEVVVCNVVNIQRGYVQVYLEDYRGLPSEKHASGMVHISELSNRWVKNINSVISVGQRTVLQVLRVNESRGYLDLSLRRINKIQRTTKMNEWRYSTKLEGLLKFFAEQHKTNIEDLYKNVLWALIDHYGDLHTAFEDIKEGGKEMISNVEDVSIEEDMVDALYNLILENITISMVSIRLEYDIRSMAGNGIELIKEAIFAAKKIRKPKGISVDFSYIGSPTYRCVIEGKDYPSLETHLGKVTDKIESTIGSNGTVDIVRDQLSNEQKA